jgi:hypothetical protein
MRLLVPRNDKTMKKAICLLVIILLASCKPKPEFYIKGKPFYTRTRCVESHSEITSGYRYGLGFNGKLGYNYGLKTETICDKEVTDTIEIKN